MNEAKADADARMISALAERAEAVAGRLARVDDGDAHTVRLAAHALRTLAQCMRGPTPPAVAPPPLVHLDDYRRTNGKPVA